MTTMIVTPMMRQWADAFTNSVLNVMEMRGEEITREHIDRITSEIREALLSATRPWSPADDYDFTRDEFNDDVSGALADRQAAKEWWRATGGDQ